MSLLTRDAIPAAKASDQAELASQSEKVGSEFLSHRQFPHVANSLSPREALRNAGVRAVHALILLTESPAPAPETVSLRAVLSKALDCAKSVRILKPLI